MDSSFLRRLKAVCSTPLMASSTAAAICYLLVLHLRTEPLEDAAVHPAPTKRLGAKHARWRGAVAAAALQELGRQLRKTALPELGPSLAQARPEVRRAWPELCPSWLMVRPFRLQGAGAIPTGPDSLTGCCRRGAARALGPPSGPTWNWAPLVIIHWLAT
jgi:hypothetical protein